jgi:hypothetical protein
MRKIMKAAAFATGLACVSGAAFADDPGAPLKIVEPRQPKQVLDVKLPELAPAAVPAPVQDFSGGDMATYWASPMLQTHDSKVSGVTYKVDGKTQYAKFGFSVVNPAAGTLEVKLTCHDKAGLVVPKYDAVLTLAPFGSAMWTADAVQPQRSTDLLTKDADYVWCSLTAPRPFAAFGTMSLSENGTGHGGTSAIHLIAIAR